MNEIYIRQILYKDIPRKIYHKGWSISFPLGTKDSYFKLSDDLVDYDLCKVIAKIKNLPTGVMHVEALGQFNYFRITYYPEKITDEKVIDFAKNINFKK